MGILRDIFGPSKEEIWRQLAHEIKADYVDGGFWKGSKVQAQFKQWTITLDTYTVSTGKSSQTYTRLRAPYVNPDHFRFTIYRKSIFTPIAQFFGAQDIAIGDEWFDEQFVIKSTDENKVRAFFANPRIRELIHNQPAIHLSVQDDEGWFGAQFPEGVDELYFVTLGVIKDVERLKLLYQLFAESLNQLCHIGSAYEDDPGLKF
ncbi:MAG TPA: DUF3137 domain-containing protein [Planctomycetota bacterium]|nr:DUF3137 domain-containing protein [Planctomycetota bacterium]